MKHKESLSPILVLFLLLALLVPSGFGPRRGASAQEPEPTPVSGPEGGGMPGYPRLAKPIPHHEPGQPSRAGSYTTLVERENEVGALEVVEISGVDAMAADGVDPLAGNYTLVNWDSVLASSSQGDQFNLQTFKIITGVFTNTIETIPGSESNMGSYPNNSIAAVDLNNDGQTEQIAAWIGENDRIFMRIGEMPGSLGRTTSKPAAVVHDDGSFDLLVRGYDEALWHRHYDGSSWGEWNNAAGGLLLSGPAIASQGNGTFDVFVIGGDNQIYQRHWDGSSWSSQWIKEGDSDDWTSLDFWFGPTPELAAPAAVARGSHIDLFRLGPDNTLRWYNGTDWQSLGGMLASGPGAVSLNENHMQVFARGVDEALWHRTYNGSWGPWQRAELDGLDAGVTIASAPSVFVSGSLTGVYVQGSDNQLWQTQCDSSGCGNWGLLGGPDGLTSGVAVAAGNWKYIVQVKTGGLMHSSDGVTWHDFGGLTPWYLLYDTGLTGQKKMIGGWQDFSLEVAPGYFWGDGRSQIALAYFSESNKVSIAIYENGEGFMPRFVTQLALPQEIDYFSMATGDFLDGDGIDDIALAYVRGNTYNLDVIEVTREGLSVKETGEPETGRNFTGILDITAGDFDGDRQDEIGLITVSAVSDAMHLPTCYSWIYSMRMRVYDLLKNPNTGDHSLKTYRTEAEASLEAMKKGYAAQVIGLAITAGDVDGDGKDELVRTWPVRFDTYADSCGTSDEPVVYRFVRKLEVLKLPDNPDNYTNSWDANNDGIISNPVITNVDERSWTDSYQDRLAVGDLNLDLKNEIIWLMSDRLRTYYHDPYADEDPPEFYKAFTDEKPLSSMKYPELATGNFTWEGIRVGPPSYRVQNRVDTLVAHLNMPPKHRDLVKDAAGNYQLVESPEGECSPSPDSPDCTHAKYAKKDFESTEQTIKTVHDYQISAGVEQRACIGAGVEGVGSGKACMQASIDATHGGNFEKSTEDIQSISFRRKVIAANDDKVVFFGTPYGVWEYPVLSGAEAESSEDMFITVAFPLVSVTQYPDTSGGYYSGTCDEAWYSANHQPNNVWSYDPIGDIRFEDYESGTDPTYDAIEGDWAEGEITGEKLTRDFGSVTFAHSVSAKLQYEAEAEASLGIVNVSTNFKAYVQGDYRHERMETDTLSAGEETTFSYFFAPQPDSAKFTTRVLFYRARDNYQVIDYQAEPGRTTAWQLYDKPDPAFILPWYGFPEPAPQAPPCGADKKLFSPSIVIDPPAARRGDTVTVTAVVRNFSNERAQNVRVRFYRGDPANNIVIGDKLIPSLARETGPERVTITWVAEGVGQQKIFAVIDPDQVIPEVHDEADDYINNNVAYGLLRLSASADTDMGRAAEKPYDLVSYDLADPGPSVSFYVPRASLNAVARFEVKAAAHIGLPAGGQAFEVVAYQGSKFKLWNEPIADFNLRPEAGDPPAVIIVAYSQAELFAMAESDLNLYRLDGAFWREAVCPGYRIERFLADDLIAVPVCQTGLFAFSDHTPEPLLPLAMFTASPTSGPAPLEVVFSDMSTGYPTGWHWDFGDGNTSEEQNPTHTYQGGGFYDVTLTVSNEAGSDTHIESSYITVTGLNADFTASPNRGEAPLTVKFTNQSSGYPNPPSSWEWDFGDGDTSTEQHPTHTYTQNGAYAVTLTVRTEDAFATKVDQNCVIVADILPIYLPLIIKGAGPPGPGGPDLVVKELTASSHAITLVIKNQGDASVTDDFWVDAYVAPSEPPRLNTIWQAIAEQGLAWGVTDPIAPGGELTLTIGGAYYVPGESEFSGMAPGTPVWAQVDAVDLETSYGAVREKNEGNNVFGPVSAVASQGDVVPPPSVEDGEPVLMDEGLPGRR